MLVAKFVRHADNKSPFKERKKKDTNDEALEATTVTLLCVVWEYWCGNCSLDPPILKDLSTKKKKDTNDDCDIAICRLGGLMTLFEQNIRQARL